MNKLKLLRAIYRASERRIADRRNVALILALAFFIAGAVFVHNLVSRDIARMHIDETTTLFLGTQFLSPWDAAPYPVHVGEMNRWLVRLLYPLGIYYMNTRMGGDREAEFLSLPGPPGAPNPATYNGWRYPGGYYLKEKFSSEDWNFAEDFKRDPNVQDYVFAMRFAIGLMAILSFSFLIWMFCLKANAVASAVYGVLVLSNSIVFSQFQWFYTEASLFLIFNLAMLLYLRAETVTYRASVWFGFLSAAALSTKLTGILVAAPVFLHVMLHRLRENRERMRDWRFEIYAITFVLSLAAINFWSKSIFNFVNETLANVYNYSGRRDAEDIPLRYFSETASDIGYPFIILYIGLFFWLVARLRRDLALVYALGVIIAFTVWSLSNATVYVWGARNSAPLYVAMSFIVALGAGNLMELVARKAGNLGKIVSEACSATAVVAFLVTAIAVPNLRLSSLEKLFSDDVREAAARCDDMAVIGLSEEDAVRVGGRSDITVFERLDWPLRSTEEDGRVVRWYEKYTNFDCLIVKRKGENKHISNYFAPLTHDMSIRMGNLFFFEPRAPSAAEREKMYREAWSRIAASAPAAQSVFDIYVDGNALIYIKQHCAPKDTIGYFFLRVHPVDREGASGGLGPATKALDFDFERHGARFDGKCMASVPLPTWDIASVRAGQSDGFVGPLWEVEISFSGDAAPPTGSAR